jgi:uncharacterized protein with GYD domain
MTTYLQLVKYTPETCAALAAEGLQSRQELTEAAMQRIGGKLLGFWAVNHADFDVAFITEEPFDVAQTAAAFIAVYGRGHMEKWKSYELASVEDTDAALASLFGGGQAATT